MTKPQIREALEAIAAGNVGEELRVLALGFLLLASAISDAAAMIADEIEESSKRSR